MDFDGPRLLLSKPYNACSRRIETGPGVCLQYDAGSTSIFWPHFSVLNYCSIGSKAALGLNRCLAALAQVHVSMYNCMQQVSCTSPSQMFAAVAVRVNGRADSAFETEPDLPSGDWCLIKA